jgi:phosphocarrier protein HPr
MFKEEMKMKSFSYTVKDELGIHARPAGMLVKEVKNFQSKVTLEKDGKSVDASRLMAVMGMGVKKDQTVTVTVEGDDEDTACEAIKAFFETNL